MTPQRRLGWLLVVLLTGQFMANVDVAIVNVAAPSIRDGLHTSGGALELVVSGYSLAYALLLVTGARLGATHGHRRLFLFGLTGFTVASLACGLAPNTAVLIGARLFQGGAAGLMVPQVLTGIQQRFTGAARGKALGAYAIALSGGAVAGQVLGGVLVWANLLGTGWRPIFLINLPIGVATLLLGLRFLPADEPGRRRRLDLPGVAVLSAALLLVVVPLVFGRDAGWPWWTWVSLVAGAPVLIGFVRLQRRIAARGGHPLLNLHILGGRALPWGLASQAAATGTYYTMLFTLALYLQQGLGRSPLYSGLALVSWVAAFGVAGPVLSRLPTERVPRFAPFGCLLLALAYLAIGLATATGRGSGALLIVLLGFGGLGLGLAYSSMMRHLTESVPAGYASDFSGIVVTLFQVAGVLGVAGLGTLYQGLAPVGGLAPATRAFTVITLCFAVIAVFGVVSALLSTRRGRGGSTEVRHHVTAEEDAGQPEEQHA
ncbi:MAG TPA: MFS transporter [Pseudonocardiaceae bacterium]|jgi:MFS family permease|nr:MFS transporter [Pseudonocardiaceae bacterium]